MTAFEFSTPDGAIVKGKNLSRLCRDHNLNYDNMRKLLNGKIGQYRGWFSTKTSKSRKRLARIRQTIYNLNTGQFTKIGLSQTKLAASFSLSKSKLSRLLTGKRLMYKGWVLDSTYSILYGKPQTQKLGRIVT